MNKVKIGLLLGLMAGVATVYAPQIIKYNGENGKS